MVTDAAVLPDVSLAQARACSSALWQGDPEGMRTLKAVIREHWAGFTAGRLERTS